MEIQHIKLTQEVCEEIFESFYSHNFDEGQYSDRVCIDDVDKHNVLNYSFTGTIEIDDVEYSFKCRNGDWNGSEILEFEETEYCGGYTLEKIHTIRTPVPCSKGTLSIRAGRSITESQYSLYLKKFECLKPRIEEIMRKESYDNYVCPSTKVSNHYREEYEKIGHFEIEYKHIDQFGNEFD